MAKHAAPTPEELATMMWHIWHLIETETCPNGMSYEERITWQLGAYHAVTQELHKSVNTLVTQGRHVGVTWQQIGDSLGCTKQAAQQRYTN